MSISCRQCRALLPGYIQRELTPRQRERVSRHLTSCAECYVVYVSQRQWVRELTVGVPRIGADAPHLDKIRAAVMAEMAEPTHPKPQVRLYHARYSVAALILMVALLLPWSMQGRSFSLPTQPRPDNSTPQGTSVVALPATEVATLTATLQSNYAPVLGATETP